MTPIISQPRGGLTYYDGSLESIIAYMIVLSHPDMGPKVKEPPPPVFRYWCMQDDVGWAGTDNRCWNCGRYTGRVHTLWRNA